MAMDFCQKNRSQTMVNQKNKQTFSPPRVGEVLWRTRPGEVHKHFIPLIHAMCILTAPVQSVQLILKFTINDISVFNSVILIFPVPVGAVLWRTRPGEVHKHFIPLIHAMCILTAPDIVVKLPKYLFKLQLPAPGIVRRLPCLNRDLQDF